jgi:hypothetical protein
MSKKGKPKEPLPEWIKQVDEAMFLYVTWGRVIKQQENIILTHQLTGLRTTPVYELREGSSGGETTYQAEKIVMAIDIAAAKIAAGNKYRADLEETIRLVAGGNPDKETFIRLYWWTGISRFVHARAALVIDALPYLAHREWGTGRVKKPNRTFYDWRKEIYEKLGELLGYR